MLRPILIGVVEGLNDGVAEHVEGEAGQVAQGVDDGTDEVVVQLNLRQNLEKQRCRVRYMQNRRRLASF